MPAEASSAVEREKDKKVVARTSRNGSPVSTCKTELEMLPKRRQQIRSKYWAGHRTKKILARHVREFSGDRA